MHINVWCFVASISFLCSAAVDFWGFTFHLQKKYRTNQIIIASRKKVAAFNLVTGLCGIYYSFFDDITEPLPLFVGSLIIVVHFIRTFYVRHATIAADRIIEEQSREEESCKQE